MGKVDDLDVHTVPVVVAHEGAQIAQVHAQRKARAGGFRLKH